MLVLFNFRILKLILLFAICNRINADPAKIEPQLLARLESGERSDIVVSFVNGVQSALTRAALRQLTDQNERKQAIVNELREEASSSQSGVLQLLSTRSAGGEDVGFTSFQSLWIGNKVLVRDANLDTALTISDDPQVLMVKENLVITIPESVVDPEGPIEKRDFPEGYKYGLWGLDKIQVKEAWEEGGTRGEGVLVGQMDTGVYADHEALSENFAGTDYGWYDASGGDLTPRDVHRHGTHVMGTFVGSFGIGVAPGAKWVACSACGSDGRCGGVLGCFQWLACPTLPNGTAPDCTKAPKIINNSWASVRKPENEKEFTDEIKVWLEMGIIPVFGVGNSGSDCNSTEPPANLPFVIGVGSTTESEYVSWTSGVGYAPDGSVKPDIVAPGSEIQSSIPYSPGDEDRSKYNAWSGTSMATPLVSGVIALMASRQPDITYQEQRSRAAS